MRTITPDSRLGDRDWLGSRIKAWCVLEVKVDLSSNRCCFPVGTRELSAFDIDTPGCTGVELGADGVEDIYIVPDGFGMALVGISAF